MQDSTQEDSENDTSLVTYSTENWSRRHVLIQTLEVDYNHNPSDCSSNCSIHQAVLDPSDYGNKDPINTCGDYQSISSGQSDEKIQRNIGQIVSC